MGDQTKDYLKNATKGKAEFQEDYNPTESHSTNAAYTPPGRLGNPKLELGNDPRIHDGLAEQFKAFGMLKHATPAALAKLNENSSLDEIAEMISEFENGLLMMYDGVVLPQDIPEDAQAPKVEMTQETIKGGDGQDMLLYIYHPAGQKESLPGVIYTHGGGMTIASTMNAVHDRWCKSIAEQGCVVVMTDFRNAYTKSGYNHFPKGLQDCVAGAKWVIQNKEKLRMSNVVLQGESGGCNLAIATAISANREGWVKDIAGVVGMVPFVSGAYGWSEERLLKEYPSLIECNGYFLDRPATAFLAHFYTPTDEGKTDPLAWPINATSEDLKGLPPHLLMMDELDMLRDEGVAFTRKLIKAGVDAKGSINLGVTHGTSLIFRHATKEYNKDAVRNVAAFARSL